MRETEEAGNGMGKSNTRAQAMWKGYEREFGEFVSIFLVVLRNISYQRKEFNDLGSGRNHEEAITINEIAESAI